MDRRTGLVLYGSETGTAQDGAEEIGRMLTRLHFATEVLELDEVEPANLMKYSVLVCTISTTGQGDIPINAKSFWKKILRAKLTSNFLASLPFAVFGFGDSSYPKYNFAALKLNKRLIQLGASPVIDLGKGDEQHPEGHESTFLPWMIDLREKLLAHFPLSPGQDPIPQDVLLEPQWLLAACTSTNGHPEPGDGDSKRAPVTSPRHGNNTSTRELEVDVEQNTRITPQKHWQDVRHLIFVSDTQATYVPGDVLVIYPQNPVENVQEMISMMHWEEVADQPLLFMQNERRVQGEVARSPSLQTSSKEKPMTLRDLLTEHLDINSIPRRSFFSLIANFTEDEFQKNRLLEFSNTEYLDELYDYTTRPRRSIIEVLQEFDTVKLPWQWAATIFPSLRGRQFSIASGGKLCHGSDGSTRIELLVAIVKYQTVIRKIRWGVCSRYLDKLSAGSRISVTLQKGGLGLTETDLSRPFVLVGPGTGVAPIRSLLWQKLAFGQRSTSNKLGTSALFFGCRNKTADYFFEDEWEHLKSSTPFEVYTAFSRDQDKKQYVQDIITENSKRVYEIICIDSGLVFICGSSGKMPIAVRLAIKKAIMKESSMLEADAEGYISTMEKNNRYKQETW